MQAISSRNYLREKQLQIRNTKVQTNLLEKSLNVQTEKQLLSCKEMKKY